jgi:hypothetical protein
MYSVVRDLVTDALTEIGAVSPGESVEASWAQIALQRFQNQIDAWAADRLTLSVQLRTLFTLTSGVSTVTLGPAGADVTMGRPVWINTLNYIIPGSSPAIEVLMAPMDDDSYAGQTIKGLQSALPTQYFYQTAIDTVLGSLFIWPQVTQNIQLALYSPQAVGVPATLDDAIEGPPGYREAFLYQLAMRLCTPFGRQVPPLLPELATQALATMKRPNVDPGLLGVDPALRPAGGNTYNVYSDNAGHR